MDGLLGTLEQSPSGANIVGFAMLEWNDEARN